MNNVFHRKKIAVAIGMLVIQTIEILLLVSLIEQRGASRQKLFIFCDNNLESSIRLFSSFSKNSAESDYWQGVAAFAHYIDLSNILEGTNDIYAREAIYLEGKAIYGQMVSKPQICKMHIEDIIVALSVIREDITSPTVHLTLSQLKNQLYEQ